VVREKLMLAEPSIGRISATYDQHVQNSIGALYYHKIKQHHYDFSVWRENMQTLIIYFYVVYQDFVLKVFRSQT
jgi:hypothetical protein